MTTAMNFQSLPISASDLRWRLYAKCKRKSEEMEDIWFPRKGKSATQKVKDAKAFCLGEIDGEPCPVLFQCREFALQRNEKFGIWGGLSEPERNRIRRARRRIQRQRGRKLIRK